MSLGKIHDLIPGAAYDAANRTIQHKMTGILDVIEAIGKLVEGGFGFRFLFSKEYRNKTIQRWKDESKTTIFFEIFEVTIGMAFMIIILVVFIKIIM